MILYFSGTGNSKFITDCLEDITHDNVSSINEIMKAQKPVSIHDSHVVFVFPSYCGRMPRVVSQCIQKLCTFDHMPAYFIATCNESAANAEHYCKKLCEECNLDFKGFTQIRMPQNHITMCDTADAEEIETLLNNAQIKKISNQIIEHKPLEANTYSLKDKVISKSVNGLFYKAFVKADGFYVTSKCIGCRKCERVCPLNNIQMKDKKPTWSTNCTHCTACINLCPVQAIEYTDKTKDRKRYQCPKYSTVKAVKSI